MLMGEVSVLSFLVIDGDGLIFFSFFSSRSCDFLWLIFVTRSGARYGMFWAMTGHENASDFYAYMGVRGPETCFY